MPKAILLMDQATGRYLAAMKPGDTVKDTPLISASEGPAQQWRVDEADSAERTAAYIQRTREGTVMVLDEIDIEPHAG